MYTAWYLYKNFVHHDTFICAYVPKPGADLQDLTDSLNTAGFDVQIHAPGEIVITRKRKGNKNE